MNDVFVVIMAGGSGTRFWPRSRQSVAKQALAFAAGGTLVQETLARIGDLVPRRNVLLVTLADQAELLCRQTGLDPHNVISEPVGRDTAACIALAATVVRHRDPDGIMIVLAADHVIHDGARFLAKIRQAVDLARNRDAVVTLGIAPTHAATGYGYIERGNELAAGIHEVRRFCEKPERAQAEEFVASGDFLWNSGMFVWRARVILDAIAGTLPKLAAAMSMVAKRVDTDEFQATVNSVYPELRRISIDKGVLEHIGNRFVVTTDFDWDDVGSFTALARHNPSDTAGNTILGAAATLDTRNCIIDNREDGLVATIGLSDLIIVRTGDAVLVARASDAERVKELVESLRARGLTRYL